MHPAPKIPKISCAVIFIILPLYWLFFSCKCNYVEADKKAGEKYPRNDEITPPTIYRIKVSENTSCEPGRYAGNIGENISPGGFPKAQNAGYEEY